MLVRAPVLVLPAEVAVEERQRRVDLVVGPVPVLGAGELHPAVDLGPLLADPGEPVVEQARDPVLDRDTSRRSDAQSSRPSPSRAATRQTGQRRTSSEGGVSIGG